MTERKKIVMSDDSTGRFIYSNTCSCDVAHIAQVTDNSQETLRVCVESYPQVYPQVVYNYYLFPPSYPQAGQIDGCSGNPH
jgi:hypothetical protein